MIFWQLNSLPVVLHIVCTGNRQRKINLNLGMSRQVSYLHFSNLNYFSLVIWWRYMITLINTAHCYSQQNRFFAFLHFSFVGKPLMWNTVRLAVLFSRILIAFSWKKNNFWMKDYHFVNSEFYYEEFLSKTFDESLSESRLIRLLSLLFDKAVSWRASFWNPCCISRYLLLGLLLLPKVPQDITGSREITATL